MISWRLALGRCAAEKSCAAAGSCAPLPAWCGSGWLNPSMVPCTNTSTPVLANRRFPTRRGRRCCRAVHTSRRRHQQRQQQRQEAAWAAVSMACARACVCLRVVMPPAAAGSGVPLSAWCGSGWLNPCMVSRINANTPVLANRLPHALTGQPAAAWAGDGCCVNTSMRQLQREQQQDTAAAGAAQPAVMHGVSSSDCLPHVT